MKFIGLWNLSKYRHCSLRTVYPQVELRGGGVTHALARHRDRIFAYYSSKLKWLSKSKVLFELTNWISNLDRFSSGPRYCCWHNKGFWKLYLGWSYNRIEWYFSIQAVLSIAEECGNSLIGLILPDTHLRAGKIIPK